MERSRSRLSRGKAHWQSLLFLVGAVAFSGPPARTQLPEQVTAAALMESAAVEVPVIDSVSSRRPAFGYCGSSVRAAGPVVTEEEFGQLTSASSEESVASKSARCAFLRRLKVDFSRHSLLTYRVNGDCFVRATAAVFRDDSNKRYLLQVTKIYGGCRAAGSFEGWLVIEKLRPEYEATVEFTSRTTKGELR